MYSIDSSSLKSLLVIDDRKIRTEMFSATAHIIKKMRRIELAHKEFLILDQRLYNDWYNLTFRQENQEKEYLEHRLKALSAFKLHLWYVSETSNLTIQEAFRILKEEERQYQNGDSDWKFIIDKLRQHRTEYAKKKKQQKRASLFDSNASEDTSNISGLNRKNRTLYYFLKEATDESVEKILNHPSSGIKFFKEIFKAVVTCGDWELLNRLWRLGNIDHKTKILKTLTPQLRNFLTQILNQKSETQIQPQKSSKIEGDMELKSLFRKLARTLHPDSQKIHPSTEQSEWSQNILQQVQAAYEAKDLHQLKRLEIITLVQLGDLSSLTLDEIYQSSLVFAEELESLKMHIKNDEKHPAWRFSSRRSYKGLSEKIRQDLKKQLAPAKAEVENLESWLSQFHA